MKAILCDLGGVLLHVNFGLAVNRLSQESGLTEQEIKDRIFSSGIKEKHDLGIISAYEFYKQIIRGEEISFEHFQVLWAEIFTENSEMIDYISSCAKSCRLYIASNTDRIHYDFLLKKYSWFSLFDGFGLSFKLKSVKPSQEFYMKLCKEININYEDALFVDDLGENIDVANHLGIKSHLFTDVTGFKQFVENSIER